MTAPSGRHQRTSGGPVVSPASALSHFRVKYGTAHYQWKSPVSSIVNKLFKKYQKEGFAMPYTIEDYLRDEKEEVLRSLTEEDLDRLFS